MNVPGEENATAEQLNMLAHLYAPHRLNYKL